MKYFVTLFFKEYGIQKKTNLSKEEIMVESMGLVAKLFGGDLVGFYVGRENVEEEEALKDG